MDLRCPSKLHGVIVREGVIEVACTSKFCGYRSGIAVRHSISIRTGEVLETRIFSDPINAKKVR